MSMTGKEMCEYIAAVWRERDGWTGDPERDIWKMSPAGELWPVFAAFEDAKAWRVAQGQAPPET